MVYNLLAPVHTEATQETHKIHFISPNHTATACDLLRASSVNDTTQVTKHSLSKSDHMDVNTPMRSHSSVG